ncbi:response regulator containing a CheY-like receiver domain and an HTH DNA-binding domain [Rivularia sp. PCC 7116]|uniref:response regulator transcription factor n=1 Tax=Rivularia sp. PCC 7116 TaxID=373994 RepID=UPI00029EE9EB|nr:response regulator transcription factor [Rivularia sp. PCC 7116]AFY53604.1 response regulator containing a CheY-like receiver domain and an HTH DNA-binding domain [Rivularia sp. PCC 7116]
MTKIRVALIEDHDLTRLGIRTALQRNVDFEIVGEAANANDGLKILKTLQPDVAIVDIGLPDKDGIELTREAKSAAPGLLTKILILTLRDSKEAVLAAFAAGADSYCMKDKYDNLLEAVKHTHNGNAWIDPAIARIVLQQAQENPPTTKATSQTNQFAEKSEFSNTLDNDDIIDPYTLTERELEVLQLIVEGCSNAVIAERLYITVGTVKTHVRNILNKLCADDRTQAAVRALRSGLVG